MLSADLVCSTGLWGSFRASSSSMCANYRSRATYPNALTVVDVRRPCKRLPKITICPMSFLTVTMTNQPLSLILSLPLSSREILRITASVPRHTPRSHRPALNIRLICDARCRRKARPPEPSPSPRELQISHKLRLTAFAMPSPLNILRNPS